MVDDPARPPTEDEKEDGRSAARFEELGPEAVKSLAAIDGFPSHWRLRASRWLDQKNAPAPEKPGEQKPEQQVKPPGQA